MAKVTYKPLEGESSFIEAFGIKFIAGEPKNIPDDSIPPKLRGNKFFEIEEEAKPSIAPKLKHENKP